MNKVASSFSLSAYDFLAVLIPGGIILSSIIYNPYFKNPIEISTEKSNGSPEWLRYTLLFILAYLLGLIWKMFMDWVFKDFRNNTEHIRKSYKKSSTKVPQLNNGLDENDPIKEAYYAAYYYLQRNDGLGSIPTIEKQIAFVRNIILLIPFLGFSMLIFFQIPSNLLITLFTFFGVTCLLFLWLYKAQSKVYELIWEGAYYYEYPINLKDDGKDSNMLRITIIRNPLICPFLFSIISILIACFLFKDELHIPVIIEAVEVVVKVAVFF